MKTAPYVSVFDRMAPRRTREEADAIRTERRFQRRIKAARLLQRAGEDIINLCEKVTQ